MNGGGTSVAKEREREEDFEEERKRACCYGSRAEMQDEYPMNDS